MSTARLPAVPPSPPAPRVGRRLFTAADLAMFPRSLPSGDVRYELNDGELVILAPPGSGHGRRQAKIVRYLDSEAEERLGLGEVWGEVAVVLRRDPDRVVGPDAVFVLAASLPVRLSPEGYLETIPEIVVEVRSRNDTGPEVLAKRDEYLAAGVRAVWVLDQNDRTVTAHRPGTAPVVFGPADALTDELLPGFSVPVARLFAGS